MAKKPRFKKEKRGSIIDHFFLTYDENGNVKEKRKTHTFDPDAVEIQFFPSKGDIPKITIRNVVRLPEELFSPKGYMQQGLGTLLSYRFGKAGINVAEIVLEKGVAAEQKVQPDGSCQITLDLLEYGRMVGRLKTLRSKSKKEIGRECDVFLASNLPEEFDEPEEKAASARLQAETLVNSIDSAIIEHLSVEDISSLVAFLGETIEKRYKAKNKRNELLKLARVQINEIPLKKIISDFRENLDGDVTEHVWSKFLRDNLLLIDPAYIHCYPELGVTLGTGPKRADFGLVDIQNFLDIFEIKRPSTKLLSAKPDAHDNYYWHADTAKPISQAEKYLYHAERKATHLAEDLGNEKGTAIAVIKPKVVLIIGSSQQLKNEKMQTDFRILRNSLRNIEVILYDELLQRIEQIADGRVHQTS